MWVCKFLSTCWVELFYLNEFLVPDGSIKKLVILDKALPPLEMTLYDKKMWACSKAVKVLFSASDIKTFE
jgi:hypothetical protein